MSLTRRLVNRLKLKHWALLSALADTPTLNQAAALIHVTQPSATKMLADIEQAFGFAIFERHARGMRPTPLGIEVVTYARHTQASLDRFLEDMEARRRGGHGHLVFGAIMGAAPDLVAAAVADIKRGRVETSLESYQCASPPRRSLPCRIFGQRSWDDVETGAHSANGPLRAIFGPFF